MTLCFVNTQKISTINYIPVRRLYFHIMQSIFILVFIFVSDSEQANAIDVNNNQQSEHQHEHNLSSKGKQVAISSAQPRFENPNISAPWGLSHHAWEDITNLYIYSLLWQVLLFKLHAFTSSGTVQLVSSRNVGTCSYPWGDVVSVW